MREHLTETISAVALAALVIREVFGFLRSKVSFRENDSVTHDRILAEISKYSDRAEAQRDKLMLRLETINDAIGKLEARQMLVYRTLEIKQEME